MRPHGLRLNSGVQGGPVDCATNCAAELAAAEAAGEVTGNAEGRLARVLDWRNPGLFATTPTQFDPSSLGTWSAPDANGEYTVTMATGTAATTPATGSSLIWPCPMANGAACAFSTLAGLVRVYATGMQAAIDNPLRWWAVIMDNPDPTLANGWGAYGRILAGSINVFTTVTYTTTTAGTWAISSGSATTAQALNGWTQAQSPFYRVNNAGNRSSTMAGTRYTLGGSILSMSGNPVVEISPTVALSNFSSGAWICVGMGSFTTALPAGDYTIRAQALLACFSQADAVGVGETP